MDQQPRFIDVTFTIAEAKLQLRFGYLYSSNVVKEEEEDAPVTRPSSSSSYYVSWRHPFSFGELKNLARSLDLVLDVDDDNDDDDVNGKEMTARAFSASFARALEESKLRFGRDKDDPGPNSLLVQCYYSELDQWGSLSSCPQHEVEEEEGGGAAAATATAGWSVSELDATCTHLLFQNLRSFDVVSSNDKTTNTNATITELDRTTVKELLERCLAQPLLHQWMLGEEGDVGTAVSTPAAPGGMPSSIPLVSTTTVPTTTNTAKIGYRQMPKKRRRGPSELKFKAPG